MAKQIFWCGPIDKCQLTGDELGDTMYDARLPSGQWGNIGQRAFEENGCRLGTGLGQKYKRQEDGRWLLVEGGSE